jgi:capsular exopolysaccharide synthesis family protein
VIFDLEQQLSELQIKYGEKNPAVIQLRDSIDKMERGLNGKILPNTEAIGPASVKIMEQAVPPLEPSGLAKPLALALAFLASILLGLILAFIFDYIDQTFKSPQEVEAFLGVSFLGSVPKMARSEAYYKLAEQVYFEMKDKKVKTLLVTSAMPKEGVSTIIAHLAKLMAAKPGCKALAIDANLRRPALHHLFKVPNNAGLVDILEDRSTFDKTVVHMSDKVSVLTAGKPDLNPVTLLESHKMTELLKNVSEKYDVVLIDGANLRETKDTLNLVPHAQGVLIVIDEGKTRKQAVRFEFEPMTDRKMVIGAILNNRTFVIPKAIYERL